MRMITDEQTELQQVWFRPLIMIRIIYSKLIRLHTHTHTQLRSVGGLASVLLPLIFLISIKVTSPPAVRWWSVKKSRTPAAVFPNVGRRHAHDAPLPGKSAEGSQRFPDRIRPSEAVKGLMNLEGPGQEVSRYSAAHQSLRGHLTHHKVLLLILKWQCYTDYRTHRRARGGWAT